MELNRIVALPVLIKTLLRLLLLVLHGRSVTDIIDNNLKHDYPYQSTIPENSQCEASWISSIESCKRCPEQMFQWLEPIPKDKPHKYKQDLWHLKSCKSEDEGEQTFIQHFRRRFRNIHHRVFYHDSLGSTTSSKAELSKPTQDRKNQAGQSYSDCFSLESSISINIGNLIFSYIFEFVFVVILAYIINYFGGKYLPKHDESVRIFDPDVSENEDSIGTIDKCRHDTVNSVVCDNDMLKENELDATVRENDFLNCELIAEERSRLDIEDSELGSTGVLKENKFKSDVIDSDCLGSDLGSKERSRLDIECSEVCDTDTSIENECEISVSDNDCLQNSTTLNMIKHLTIHDNGNVAFQGTIRSLNGQENRKRTEEKIQNQENGNMEYTTDTIGCLMRSKGEHRKVEIIDLFEVLEDEYNPMIVEKFEKYLVCHCESFYDTSGKDHGKLKKNPRCFIMPVFDCMGLTSNIYLESELTTVLRNRSETRGLILHTFLNKKCELICVPNKSCETVPCKKEIGFSHIVSLDTGDKTKPSITFGKFPDDVKSDCIQSEKANFSSPTNINHFIEISKNRLQILFHCNDSKRGIENNALLDCHRSSTSETTSNRIINNVTKHTHFGHDIKLVLDLQTDDTDEYDFNDIKDFYILKDIHVNREEILTDPYRNYSDLPSLSKKIVNSFHEKQKMLADIENQCEIILKLKGENLPFEHHVDAKVFNSKTTDPCLENILRNKHSEVRNQELEFDFSFSRNWYIPPVTQRICHVYMLTIPERIETFRFWPSDAAVSKIDLVEAGFIYKGDGYEVECGTCHFVKSDWSSGDLPLMIHKALKPDCEFLRTTFPDLQVPTGRYETDNTFQLEGQQTLVNQMDSMSIRNRASQFEYNLPTTVKNHETANNSQAQSSFVTAPQQEPLFDGAYTSMNPSTLFPQGATALTSNDELSIAGVPPRHPDFASIQQRIWSFRPWTYSHIQDPVYLVDAGFYYIGKEDIVRCYFCDIGLAEWDAEDDPWSEHARHSPECEYLKREKGPEFIENIQVSWRQIYCPRHPEFSDYHVRVETYANWPSDLDQRPNALAEAGFYYTGEDDVVRCHYCDGGLRQWEPGDVPWTEHARWFPFCKYIVKIKGLAFVEDIARRYNFLTQSPAVDPETQMIDDAMSEGQRYSNLPNEVYDRILELGYTCRQINRAFHQHVQMTGRRHASADELTNILLENDFSVPSPINNQPSTAAKEVAMKTPSDIENLEPEKLLDMNKQLRSQLICIICNKNESNIVFIPCGHRNTCENCSKDFSTCKTCGSKIEAKIKSYLA